MPHTIEAAASRRSKCRGCQHAIAKGELRFGERLPNPFADEEKDEMTLWFHLACAAYKRPEPFLETLPATDANVPDAAHLEADARAGVKHRRLPRVDGAERAPTGRASCRHCRETIAKGAWRIRLVYFEEGQFSPSGFIHASCAEAYLGTSDVVDRALCFGAELTEEERADLERALRA